MEDIDINSVSIRIKSASHRCEDLEFPCKLSSSVLNLKKLIQLKNPLHPGVSEQRLIYSGHLLDDEQLIRDIISHNNPNDTPQSAFTFHLACTSKSYVPYNTVEPQRAPKSHGSPPEPVQPSINQPTFPSTTPQGGIPPDVLALHQLYVEQMMAFMAQWSQGNVNSFGGPQFQYHIPEQTQAQANANYAQVQEQLLREVRNEARDNPREVARVRADDEENPRDMLDWMYTFSRLILVFSVVYFYSNFTRFFLVVIFTALVMIMQRRHQGNAEGDVRVQDAADAHPVPQQQQAPANAGEQNREEDGNVNGAEERPNEMNNVEGNKNEDARRENFTGNSEAEELQAAAEVPPVPPRLNQIREIGWTFLSTFFTSLIPDTPQN